MFEKVKTFFQNEKARMFFKKVFSRKTLIGAAVIIVLAVALRVGFFLMFEVQGTVQKIDGSKITVANILTTKTVDAGEYPIASMGIQPGDRIEIIKNLSGQVISIRDESRERMRGIGKDNFDRGQNFGRSFKHNFRGRR